jgi:hypothetical protein
MAKALIGYVGGTDPRVLAEMRRLQRRVRDLEDEVVRLRAANDALSPQLADDELIALSVEHEPALT